MGLSTLSLIVLLASSAVYCAKPYKPSEICACVPLNICPEINRFNKEDARYFATILKCKEGFIRCCPNNESVNSALRRSDDDDNVILIDDNFEKTDFLMKEFDTTTETIDPTTLETENEKLETDTTTEIPNEPLTTEIPSTEIDVEISEKKRKSKFIDNNISVVYPNTIDSDKKKEVMEHLFLIFPNGEIETALATSTGASLIDENSSIKPVKHVIVRKRLIKKTSESLEGAESQISEAVIEPKPMDIKEVKKRLSVMNRHNKRRNHLSSTTATTTTTESPAEETTVKHRKKVIKFRKKITTTAASSSLKPRSEEKVQTTTIKSSRKIIYDASSRTNFLKRPSSQNAYHDDEELNEPEVIATTTEPPTESTMNYPLNYLSLETIVTTPMPQNIVQHWNKLDFEHKAMIEAVYKTLSAIHSGVDIKFVEKMIESHKTRMKENRKNAPTSVAFPSPTIPYRGSARFRKPVTNQPVQDGVNFLINGTRTRNLSRTRSTHHTTHKSTRKAPRTTVTHKQINPIINSNSLPEEVDMPPKQKPPLEFRASPLYGITMDRFNEMDTDTIEKIHETLRLPSGIQNGFFPVIQNGTPSTLH